MGQDDMLDIGKRHLVFDGVEHGRENLDAAGIDQHGLIARAHDHLVGINQIGRLTAVLTEDQPGPRSVSEHHF